MKKANRRMMNAGSAATRRQRCILHFSFFIWAGVVLASHGASSNTPAARTGTTNVASTNALPALTPIPQSTFLIPKSRAEGVDPFFPISKRLEFVEPDSKTNQVSVVGELVLKGFSGSATAPLVIINDHTFGVGDEGEVTTPQGRVKLRCLEIHLRTESVIISAGDQRRELRFRSSR